MAQTSFTDESSIVSQRSVEIETSASTSPSSSFLQDQMQKRRYDNKANNFISVSHSSVSRKVSFVPESQDSQDTFNDPLLASLQDFLEQHRAEHQRDRISTGDLRALSHAVDGSPNRPRTSPPRPPSSLAQQLDVSSSDPRPARRSPSRPRPKSVHTTNPSNLSLEQSNHSPQLSPSKTSPSKTSPAKASSPFLQELVDKRRASRRLSQGSPGYFDVRDNTSSPSPSPFLQELLSKRRTSRNVTPVPNEDNKETTPTMAAPDDPEAETSPISNPRENGPVNTPSSPTLPPNHDFPTSPSNMSNSKPPTANTTTHHDSPSARSRSADPTTAIPSMPSGIGARELETRLDRLTKENFDLKLRDHSRRQTLDARDRRIGQLTANVEDLQQQAFELESRLVKAERVLGARDVEISELGERLRAVEGEVDAERRERRELEREVGVREAALAEAADRICELEDKLERRRLRRREERRAERELEREVERSERRNEALEGAVEYVDPSDFDLGMEVEEEGGEQHGIEYSRPRSRHRYSTEYVHAELPDLPAADQGEKDASPRSQSSNGMMMFKRDVYGTAPAFSRYHGGYRTPSSKFSEDVVEKEEVAAPQAQEDENTADERPSSSKKSRRFSLGMVRRIRAQSKSRFGSNGGTAAQNGER